METMQTIWPQAIAKAWQDEAFRQALLTDAPSALKQHFSLEIPSEMKLRVVEGGKTTGDTLVLPSRPVDLDDGLIELNEPEARADACSCCCC
jgi:hypothetical protein